ncbi:rhodanese-like domain-containing protein [Cognatitamlana onchidii]|uniref:rhodanese-like domain-containing protein n=1 Tax=Cognatitamlana onchidii TaxID=2562860 RepID=UPI0010A66722|nr:rhodanese-like domain-containing protein [Algibacter onchidii]
MGILNLLFGNRNNDIKSFKEKGAIIIDVRTPQEYHKGAIQESINVPLQTLKSKIADIEAYQKPIITCCASGIRSANAASILKSNNINAINGGGWKTLKSKLKL